MRITKSRNKHRQIAYTAELSEYDAEPPSRTWLLDDLPNKINPELEAVALYLVFGRWCGGEFEVPQKMGPNTAAAIERHASMDFFPGPIEYYPKPIFRGTRVVTLTDSFHGVKQNTLVCLNGSNWTGSLKATSTLLLSSNTEVFASPEDPQIVLLAPALLLAEELDIAEIALDSGLDAMTAELADLLRQVGIALRG